MKGIIALLLVALAACIAAKHLAEDVLVVETPGVNYPAVVPDQPAGVDKVEVVEEVEEVEVASPILGPNGCPLNTKIHWLTENEFDCSQYFACVWGEKVAMSCPGSLHFNKVLQVCDWPWAAGCDSAPLPELLRAPVKPA